MSEIWMWLGGILTVVGALVFATAALGLLKFPDAYSRVSAVGTAGGLGIVLVVLGALVLQPGIGDAVKAVIINVLQLMTSAVGTMAIARSAVLVRTPFARLRYDELHEEHEHHDE